MGPAQQAIRRARPSATRTSSACCDARSEAVLPARELPVADQIWSHQQLTASLGRADLRESSKERGVQARRAALEALAAVTAHLGLAAGVAPTSTSSGPRNAISDWRPTSLASSAPGGPAGWGLSAAGYASATQAVDIARAERLMVMAGGCHVARGADGPAVSALFVDAALALGGGLDLASLLRGVGHGAPQMVYGRARTSGE